MNLRVRAIRLDWKRRDFEGLNTCEIFL